MGYRYLRLRANEGPNFAEFRLRVLPSELDSGFNKR
jgi:hypothetical protein